MKLVRSEWIKLTTVTSHRVLWAVGLAFPLVITLLVSLLAEDVEIFVTRDLVDVIAGTSVVAALLFGVVGTLSITSEFAHLTIRPTLAATPRRIPVLVAKAAVVSSVSAVLGVVVWLGCFSIGSAILGGRGAEISFGDDGVGSALAGAPIYFFLVALFGFGLGALFRSSPASISTLVLWPLLVEGLIAAVLTVAQVDDAERFLPYTSGTALLGSTDADGGLGRVGGGVYFAVFTAALALAGVVLNTRRDV